MRDDRDPKSMAKALREALAARGHEIAHSEALEIVARQLGEPSWNVLSGKMGKAEQAPGGIALTQPLPIFRIFDEAKAREFYLGFLDMSVEFEHRFHEGAPLYMGVARGAMKLHLSEHSGDASPGATAIMYMKGVAQLQRQLLAKNYRYNRPGLEEQEWGLQCTVTDPFGNRIRFLEDQAG